MVWFCETKQLENGAVGHRVIDAWIICNVHGSSVLIFCWKVIIVEVIFLLFRVTFILDYSRGYFIPFWLYYLSLKKGKRLIYITTKKTEMDKKNYAIILLTIEALLYPSVASSMHITNLLHVFITTLKVSEKV